MVCCNPPIADDMLLHVIVFELQNNFIPAEQC